MPRFPQNIFQVWYQGCNNIQKKEFIENKELWKSLNLTWNYYCLSDEDMSSACKLYSEKCHEIYQSLPLMHMKIDLGRYVLVYIYGGMYIDMDAYAFRHLEYNPKINEIISKYENENKHVLGLSKINLHKFEQAISKIEYNNAFMISSPGNPTLKRFIDYILDQCSKYNKDTYLHSSHNAIQFTTGPYSFNYFFRNNKIKDSLIYTFDSEIFEPCDLNHQCEITKNTIAIHQFEMSWLSPFMKYMSKLYFYLRNRWIIMLIIILLIYYYK